MVCYASWLILQKSLSIYSWNSSTPRRRHRTGTGAGHPTQLASRWVTAMKSTGAGGRTRHDPVMHGGQRPRARLPWDLRVSCLLGTMEIKRKGIWRGNKPWKVWFNIFYFWWSQMVSTTEQIAVLSSSDPQSFLGRLSSKVEALYPASHQWFPFKQWEKYRHVYV